MRTSITKAIAKKTISLAMKTFPTFGHLDGKLPFIFPEMSDERVVDDGLVDLRSDKFGLEEFTLNARLSTNLNFEMHRDFSDWRFYYYMDRFLHIRNGQTPGATGRR
jgi:hypothetical protein